MVSIRLFGRCLNLIEGGSVSKEIASQYEKQGRERLPNLPSLLQEAEELRVRLKDLCLAPYV